MSTYPFPGMNPYFEQPSLWPNIHLGLINAIQVDLTPKVVPAYYVTAEERTYIPMTEEIREYYLEIRQTNTDEVVTVIEVLSPTNKRAGIGRSQYTKKREQVLSSLTNLVEIDLLRAGKSFDVSPQYETYHYRILVSRGWQRPRGDLYPFNVTQPIPAFPVPLQRGETEPTLDLGNLLETIYKQARYDLRIDYARNPTPGFGQADDQWLDATLREAGLRQ